MKQAKSERFCSSELELFNFQISIIKLIWYIKGMEVVCSKWDHNGRGRRCSLGWVASASTPSGTSGRGTHHKRDRRVRSNSRPRDKAPKRLKWSIYSKSVIQFNLSAFPLAQGVTKRQRMTSINAWRLGLRPASASSKSFLGQRTLTTPSWRFKWRKCSSQG